jgi:glutamate/tyrosine decarboxylase-like PLP-dependent enzyme
MGHDPGPTARGPRLDDLREERMSDYPYADRFPVVRGLPEVGRPRAEVLAEIAEMARAEDAYWETGKVSGTMYSGDHEHYAFLSEAFGRFAHSSALQRDLCPSATRFEGEILAMVLDLMHASAVDDGEPAGMMTMGGTGSILHALLAYRDDAARRRGITRPNVIKPVTGHPAFNKACHMFGIECRTVPVDPRTTLVDPATVAAAIDDNTIALVGSAGNYPYGTIDPIEQLGALAQERGIGLHVDACLGGFILPFGEELGYDVPAFDFRIPGVTTISADTHKYGYAFKGSSTLVFRDKALRNAQYFHLVDWPGGKYMSPGMEGSRSVGLLAATWAAMVSLGREGYRRYAEDIFRAAAEMIDVVRSHPQLRIMGNPTFCFSFTSDDFDIYHVADFMRPRGWRFNGQQYPNAIHMAVTRPQTRPGVVAEFAADLAEAVQHARQRAAAGAVPELGAIYGGVPGGVTAGVEQFIVSMMDSYLDRWSALPPEPAP